MTDSGQTVIELSGGELREMQRRAFLAGWDQRKRDEDGGSGDLEEAFGRWHEHETGEHLAELLERTR